MCPHLRSSKVEHSHFSEKDFSFFGENVCRTFAVKVADFAQKTERGGVNCFASPDSGVQNGYWVNTTRSVYEG
jgi:hypothetical protein